MQNDELASLGGSSLSFSAIPGRFRSALLGEEQPGTMLVLLGFLVFLLHLWLILWLFRPSDEPVTEAQPLVMEVSMIAMSAPKPVAAPPKPAPPPPPPSEKKPPPPKKTPPKPVVKKPPPVVQKAPDFAPSEAVAEQPQPVAQPTPTPASSTSSASTASSESKAAPTNTEQFTEANFRANYAHNPKPEYPPVAKSRGWTGKVLLRVQVSAEGLSNGVAVEQSSGHEMLDDAAVEAVKQWRFIPAKRGETPVASSVIVPIIFTLRN